MPKKILITGIGGYVGSNVALKLLDSHEVVGIGRGTKFPFLKSIFGEKVRLVESDIADEKRMREASEGADVIIHSASPVSAGYLKEHPKESSHAIVEGTKTVSNIAREKNIFLIHLSSQAVYSAKRERPMPLSEEDLLMPDTFYGELKAEAEREAVLSKRSLILRLGYVFGAGSAVPMHSDVVISIFIAQAREGGPIIVYGDGSQGLDFVHIDDVSRLLSEFASKDVSLPRVLNVSYGKKVTSGELALIIKKEVKRHLDKDAEIVFKNSGEPRPSRWLSSLKLHKVAPWFPSVTLEEGVRELLEK
jgi:UDP-glucose 4-epimerase